MTRSTDIRLCDVRASIERLEFRTPMKFGGRVVADLTLLDVEVDVETRGGRRGRGRGSMPMGNVWAWPRHKVSADETSAAMIELGQRLARNANDYRGWGHPLQITRDLEADSAAAAEQVAADPHDGRPAGRCEPIPKLALLVAASPLEAAIHDAYGKALGENSYNLLGAEFVAEDLSAWLGGEFAGEYLDRYTLRQPKPRMPLYHLVGALDPLTAAEVADAAGDGLPETLPQWIARDGLTHLKIKLNGDDLAWDVERVIAVDRAASAARAVHDRWHYSADFNERCSGEDYVLDFLAQLKARAPDAWRRLEYLEQPTARDLRAASGNRMYRVARIKPVVIDESLVDLESLQAARELGYSGVALKTCKGHSGALLTAAAAQKYGMFLCVQDLTCPGASFLHSAGLAARVPGVGAVEGNARQYCPAGNRGWEDRFPTLFHPTDGTVETALLSGPGLGF